MTEIVTSSGAKVVIGMAPFKAAMALKNAIARELAVTGVQIESVDDFTVGSFLPAILTVDSSPAVYAALFDCLARCSYNGDKITENTFENATARADYYDIVLACAKENLSPFFKNLASKLSQFRATATDGKTKSPT